MKKKNEILLGKSHLSKVDTQSNPDFVFTIQTLYLFCSPDEGGCLVIFVLWELSCEEPCVSKVKQIKAWENLLALG